MTISPQKSPFCKKNNINVNRYQPSAPKRPPVYKKEKQHQQLPTISPQKALLIQTVTNHLPPEAPLCTKKTKH